MHVLVLKHSRVALVALLALPLAGCHSGSSQPRDAPSAAGPSTTVSSTPASSTPTSSAVTTPAGPAGAAITAYLNMWQAMVQAEAVADYEEPALARYATASALTTLVSGLYTNFRQGLVTKGTPHFAPHVGQMVPAGSPTEVVIADCMDDSHWLLYVKKTGALQNNTPGGHHKVEALVVESDGVWRVSQLAVHGVGTC